MPYKYKYDKGELHGGDFCYLRAQLCWNLLRALGLLDGLFASEYMPAISGTRTW